MAEENVSLEGNAVVEAFVRVPTTNELIPFFTSNVLFHSARITETVDGFQTWEITVQTSDRNLVDNYVKNASAGGTPRIRVRIGLGMSQNVSWLPWQELIIRQPISKFTGIGNSAGYFATFVASDLLWEINRVNRVLSRKGKISTIISDIANFYGIPAVVETTKYEGLWIQSYLSDYEFVTQRLLHRATNDKGRGNYKFFMQDNTLHFHTIDYQTTLKEYSFFAEPGADLIVTDASQEVLDEGAGGVRYVIHDPYSGTMQELLSKREDTLRLGSEAPTGYEIKGIQRNVMFHIGSNRAPEALSMTTSVFEEAKTRAFNTDLTIPKSIYFRAGDIVNLVINPNKGETTPTSGYYYVPKVIHTIDRNAITSLVSFQRGEWQGSTKPQSALLQSGENILSTPYSATGQSINLNAAGSSQITRGAGKEASRKKFLDASNPNTAPS